MMLQLDEEDRISMPEALEQINCIMKMHYNRMQIAPKNTTQ